MSAATLPNASTSQAAVFRWAGDPLHLSEFPLPELQPGEALVRISCCTLCGSDLHTLRGERVEPTPSILGHEALGYVHAVAAAPDQGGRKPAADLSGRPLQVGDRVTWSPVVSCSTCDRCRRGLPQKCRQLFKYGHAVAEGRGALCGGLAEFILLRPDSAIVRVDDGVPDYVAGPANCATATVAGALRIAGDVRGKSVLILGAGMLGLTAAAMARAQHAGQITISDPNPHRLQLAARFGADHALPWVHDRRDRAAALERATGSQRFDLVLELSGAPVAVEACVTLADVGATIVLVGSVMESPTVPVDPACVVRNCLTIAGLHNYAPIDLQTAVDFLRDHHHAYPFAELVEREFPLSEVNAAVAFAMSERPVRVAIRPYSAP